MKEHTYQLEFSKAIKESLLVWVTLILQVSLSFFLICNEGEMVALIISNLVLSLFSIPGLIIHLNHLNYSRNAKLILRRDTITFINRAEEITLKTFEVIKVVLHQSPSGSRLPWWNFSWFELIDKEGQSIKVSCYFLEIGEFWQDTLSHRVDSNNFVRKEVFFPLMK
ncbi:hypothetical protein [Fluviicola sp.]|uniref:hypothetical protein n=1 Tax=Fluviicola sp. TaxID=1917219 RepID=UPI0031DF3B9C